MAHTAFFERLIQAGRVAAEATNRNVSVDRILDEHAAANLNRRQFVGLGLAAAGLAAAGLAACGDAGGVTRLIEPRVPQRKSDPRLRVVVVGAGLAGLTCAYRLRQAGIDATVYEASNSLGGRCATRRGDFADGQIAEHGGELIDQSHGEIRRLAQELGLPLDNLLQAEPNGSDPFYFFDGARYSFADATRDLKAIWQTIHSDLSAAGFPTLYSSYTPRGWQLDHMSLAQWIDANVPGGRASRLGQLLETAYVIEYGADATTQSALNLIYLIGYSGQGQLRIFGQSNEKYHVRGGNDLIVQRLAASLDSGQIVTGTPLAAIARTNSGGYTLTFGTGGTARTVTADHVVLTVPFSVMRSGVNFSAAGFNDVKRLAIAELGMGANAKLNVQFKSRHWAPLGSSGETYSDTGYQNHLGSHAGAGGAVRHSRRLFRRDQRARTRLAHDRCTRARVPVTRAGASRLDVGLERTRDFRLVAGQSLDEGLVLLLESWSIHEVRRRRRRAFRKLSFCRRTHVDRVARVSQWRRRKWRTGVQ